MLDLFLKIIKSKIIKIFLILIISIIVLYLSIYLLDIPYGKIVLKTYFDTNQEYQWALNLSKGPIDFYNQPFDKIETQEIKYLGGLKNSPESYLHLSPSGKYRFEYKRIKKRNGTNKLGFIIYDHTTNKPLLVSDHWVLHPSCVKWIFNEEYIIYMHQDDSELSDLCVYVGKLKTGKILSLTTATRY